jgi:ornithine cyclodeaminase/alanine dehydrogenase-like protein (mu-crystallin family)
MLYLNKEDITRSLNMLYLNKEDILAAITFHEAMEAIERAYALFTSGQYHMPQRIHLDYKNKTILYMPCFSEDSFATKMLTVFPENIQHNRPAIEGLMILNDYHSGEPRALLEGKTLTSMRTGAVGGVAIRYLSAAAASTVGIVGAGAQGFYQALFAAQARDIQEIYLFDAYKDNLSEYINQLKLALNNPQISIKHCLDISDLLSQSDIVITTTTATEPVLPDDPQLLAGKCFVGIGSYKPNMREFPPAIWQLVDNVYIDLPLACQESGDLSQPLAEGLLAENQIKPLGEFLASKNREALGSTNFFKTVGMALFDLTVAEAVYQQALSQNIGQVLKY